MKLLILGLVSILSLSSHAFTKKNVYTCMNGEKVTVQSSLMPDGDRFLSAYTSTENLKSVACEDIADEWSSYGSENCYVGEQTLFSHYEPGHTGMLKLKVDGQIYFTVCEQTESIQ